MTDLQSLERLPRARSQSDESSVDWSLRSKETVEHQIAEILREKIIVGVIARGQKLKQAEIARLLGVSITPVREALRLLEAQGYVAVRAHRGAIVAPLVVEGAEELYELRQVPGDPPDPRSGATDDARRPQRLEGAQSRFFRRSEIAVAAVFAGEKLPLPLSFVRNCRATADYGFRAHAVGEIPAGNVDEDARTANACLPGARSRAFCFGSVTIRRARSPPCRFISRPAGRNFSQIIAKRAGVERIRLLRPSGIQAVSRALRWSAEQHVAPLSRVPSSSSAMASFPATACS